MLISYVDLIEKLLLYNSKIFILFVFVYERGNNENDKNL